MPHVKQFFTTHRSHFLRVFLRLSGVIGTLLIALLLYAAVRFGVTPRVLFDVITANPTQLRQYQNRINIVLLGMGGANHEGGDLTDTIAVYSVDVNTHDQVIISIPRDIWIADYKDKINAAFRVGEAKAPGGGLILAKSVVEEVIGLPIHFAALIDFSGFVELIDAVGGIDVAVDESFTDNKYPLKNKENDFCDGDPEFLCRYETITFQKGMEHMDGARALKYVRSRNATGEIGTDFSRGRRQQAVLTSLKAKLLSNMKITKFSNIKSLLGALSKTITTDMSTAEILLLGRQFTISNSSPRHIALTQDEPEKNSAGLLINPPLWQYDNKWVLVPKHESYERIGEYVNCVIEDRKECGVLIE